MIDRRRLMQALAGAATLAPIDGLAQGEARPAAAAVNRARLRQTLEDLSVFGRPAGGTFADGVSRIAYSDADVAGRAWTMGLMRQAGLDPRVDAAGNITGRRAGRDPALKPIILGSHIDSVLSGGNFDGDLGSLAAIEIARTLNDHQMTTRHPLEITLWSNEEGGTIGSAAAVEAVPPALLDQAFNGIVMREGLRKIGGDPDRIAGARRTARSFRCYLELHIEQGGFLEKAGIPIGVVDGIVCIDDFDVEIRGFANHAGTTPMPGRRDALFAAAKMIEAVREIATREPGRQVGTVGRLAVFPNAPNVIPGLVKHSVEFRDLSDAEVAAMGEALMARAKAIAEETGTTISITRLHRETAALADPAVQREIEAAAGSLGLKTLHLPSGAGHDAQNLAKLGPMGMIFVPSIGGISHSPRELSRWEDCGNGADVLLRTMLRIDQA